MRAALIYPHQLFPITRKLVPYPFNESPHFPHSVPLSPELSD